MNKLKRAITVCLSVLISASLFTPFSAASDENGYSLVYEDIGSELLLSVSDAFLDGFNSADAGWRVTGGDCMIEGGDSTLCPPYEGDGSLTVYSDDYDKDKGIVIKKTFNTDLLGGDYKYIALSVFLPEDTVCDITLRLVCEDETATDEKTVTGGGYRAVFFDVGNGAEGRIRRVELTFKLSSKTEPDTPRLSIDTLVACRDDSSLFALKYLARGYNGTGCSAEVGSLMKITLSGASEQYIEAVFPTVKSLGNNTGIRIDYINASSCRSLTLKIKRTGAEGYDTVGTAQINGAGISSTLLFPIGQADIESFAIVFDGGEGTIDISSVSVSECYCPVQPIGAVTECRIGADKQRITVKGTLSALSDSETVYLYSLPLWENASDLDISHRPLTETELNENTFSFTIPLSENRDELYRKFVPAVYVNGRITPITDAVSVSNPDVLASERTYLPSGKKGSRGLSENYRLDGISQTVIDVRADKLLTFSESDVAPYEYGDAKYRFSKSYLDELDGEMKKCADGGIAVRFMLCIECPSDLALQDIICHPS